MPDPSNASGVAPRPLLSLAAELEAAQDTRSDRPSPPPHPRRAGRTPARPGALARALAEARERAAAGASSPWPSGVMPQPAASPPAAGPSRNRMVALLAGGAALGGALVLSVTPALSGRRDLALGALLCLALGLVGIASGPLRPKPRLAHEPPAPPAPPPPDELRLSLLAVRRAMAEPPETSAQAST